MKAVCKLMQVLLLVLLPRLLPSKRIATRIYCYSCVSLFVYQALDVVMTSTVVWWEVFSAHVPKGVPRETP